MLMAANALSTYGSVLDEDALEMMAEDEFDPKSVDDYVFEPVPGELDAVVVLQSIACYGYQAGDPDGWWHSPARGFVNALHHHVAHQVPGVDDAPWGFDDREYFLKRG